MVKCIVLDRHAATRSKSKSSVEARHGPAERRAVRITGKQPQPLKLMRVPKKAAVGASPGGASTTEKAAVGASRDRASRRVVKEVEGDADAVVKRAPRIWFMSNKIAVVDGTQKKAKDALMAAYKERSEWEPDEWNKRKTLVLQPFRVARGGMKPMLQCPQAGAIAAASGVTCEEVIPPKVAAAAPEVGQVSGNALVNLVDNKADALRDKIRLPPPLRVSRVCGVR